MESTSSIALLVRTQALCSRTYTVCELIPCATRINTDLILGWYAEIARGLRPTWIPRKAADPTVEILDDLVSALELIAIRTQTDSNTG